MVDTGGNLVSHDRMDGAWTGSVDISINKAFTARAFDSSTADLATSSQPGQRFFGINASNVERVMMGVSGGSGEHDQSVAEAAAAAFEPVPAGA